MRKVIISFCYLASLFLLWPASSLCDQFVMVRIVSAKDGQPLKNQAVSVSYLYDKTEKAPPNLDAVLHLQTDANGEAAFSLPEPAPAHLWAVVHLTSENWRCGCLALADTQEVIRNGITLTQTSQKTAASTNIHIQAQPGEIVFTARPLTFFERILQPLLKQ
jgi:hypothetical protein